MLEGEGINVYSYSNTIEPITENGKSLDIR